MGSLKLMRKDSVFAENLKNTEIFVEFFSSLLEGIQALDLSLQKVLVSVGHICKGLPSTITSVSSVL